MFQLRPGTNILTGDQIDLPTGDYQEIRYAAVHFLRGETPELWKNFPDGESNWANLSPEEARLMAEQLKNAIVSGKVQNLWLSFDPWGEDYFLSADFDRGRAALLYNAIDLCGITPCGPDRPDAWEDAHVDIGGQTPVPMACALEDMDQTARIILYFLDSGKLSPEIKWAVESTGGLPWV